MAIALSSRRLAHVTIPVLALCAVGCFGPQRDWTDDLAWSPDGRRAAVVIAGGLHVSDAAGHLSPLLASDVYRVAWLGDSERLVFARSRAASTFAEISAAVGPERSREIVAGAEHLWMHMQAPDWRDNIENSSEFWTADAAAFGMYLAEHHAAALREKLGEEADAIESEPVRLHTVVVARVTDDGLKSLQTLSEDLTPIKTIRPDPRGRFVAYVAKDEEFLHDDIARTFVVAVDGSHPRTLVAARTGEFPDWTRDGRSLLLLHARVERDLELGTLGCLARWKVLDANDRVEIEQTRPCVVDLIFESRDRIRSLADGRVLFDTDEQEFPRETSRFMVTFQKKDGAIATALDPPRYRHLFVFDLSQEGASPVPLIPAGQLEDDAIGYFDVSPDGTRLIYSTARGRMRLLTVATRRSELLPLGLERREGYTVRDLPRAVWAGNGAFTYIKNLDGRNAIILRRGSTEVVLNRNWPQ